jgi:hypothetical protein
MKPEAKVKVWLDKQMKEWFPDAIKYSPPGVGYFGKNGMPDRIWWIRANEYTSITVAIEAKSDDGKPTGIQLKTLGDLARQGVIAAIVVGKDLSHLERIKDEVLRRIRLAS